jgi:hypothetical protein
MAALLGGVVPYLRRFIPIHPVMVPSRPFTCELLLFPGPWKEHKAQVNAGAGYACP